MAIVDDVLDELTQPRRHIDPLTNWMKEADRVLRASAIEVIEIIANTNEDAIRTLLKASVGNGEAASISVASHRLDLIFVTEDNKAVHGNAKLYRQLPGEVGRIMGLHAFLRVLVERDALAPAHAKTVATVRDPALPHWWTSWFGSIRITQ
ncbi:MAG: hypothetical protein IPM54_40715 [Polyangiaceae bacterium]|nr:hypothetical protein [Polyangiaceae bacterium]